jgi:hypothetical protein
MDPISISNQRLLDFNLRRKTDFYGDPQTIYRWYLPCVVEALLVTDGAPNFGRGDFGLVTFVQTLQYDRPSYVRFDLTLAHLRGDVAPEDMMQGETSVTGIRRRILNFCFDEADHFTPNMYDEVWMFGYETSFHRPNSPYTRRDSDRVRYPDDRLGDAELRNLSAHMNGGGGVFATGDHGALGRALCGSVNRVRGMRHWASFPSEDPLSDQVSMKGQYRNDTNQIGHDFTTEFSDQSDDVPQTLDLLLYGSPSNASKYDRYPHPVLCGRMGRIEVLPDHPHEGECRTPDDLTLTYEFDGSTEYPPATNGSGQIPPEVIARSRVRAGNDARRSKLPTIAHTFGAISAYDGHRAGVGRVVCDATWHHFVNVNLIGVLEGGLFDEFGFPGEDPSKHNGFLSSPLGRAALDKIRSHPVHRALSGFDRLSPGRNALIAIATDSTGQITGGAVPPSRSPRPHARQGRGTRLAIAFECAAHAAKAFAEMWKDADRAQYARRQHGRGQPAGTKHRGGTLDDYAFPSRTDHLMLRIPAPPRTGKQVTASRGSQ